MAFKEQMPVAERLTGWAQNLGGLALVLSSLWSVGGQCIEWLKEGEWAGYSVSDFFEQMHWKEPHTTWVGLQKISDMFFNLPAALVGIVIGFWLINRGFHNGEKYSEWKSKKKMAERDEARRIRIRNGSEEAAEEEDWR
jgi:hypothetical protein